MSENSYPLVNEEGVHQDQLTLEQLEKIQSSIAQTQPMVSAPLPVRCLLDQYQDAHLPGFTIGIDYLDSVTQSMRKIRGDGNCFYRAFWFGYLEALLALFLQEDNPQKKQQALEEQERIKTLLGSSLQELVALGYPEFALESFHEELMEVLSELFTHNEASLLEMFQEGGKADYLTWFMRVLTAGYLRRHADRFLPFVEGCYVDMDAYCKGEVEPMNKECEQLSILALTEYLEVQVKISYLDGRSNGKDVVALPESPQASPVVVHLLYRPGHYDLIYPKV